MQERAISFHCIAHKTAQKGRHSEKERRWKHIVLDLHPSFLASINRSVCLGDVVAALLSEAENIWNIHQINCSHRQTRRWVPTRGQILTAVGRANMQIYVQPDDFRDFLHIGEPRRPSGRPWGVHCRPGRRRCWMLKLHFARWCQRILLKKKSENRPPR